MTLIPLALLKLSFARFLLSGGLNTAVTYGIFLLLLMFSSYTTSFTLAYVAGILLTYVMNRFFVFKHHQGLKSIIWLPFVYVLQYLLAMIILYYWVDIFGITAYLGPLAAIVITLPVTYFFSRFLFQNIDAK